MKHCPVCKRELKDQLVFCPFDGQPLIEKHETDTFTDLLLDDKYRLEEMIGKGGMGTVYRALHVQMENKVAVKILHPHLASDHIAVERFRREARAAAQIRHPNAVAVTDFGVTRDSEIAYLVMEFLEGEDLRGKIKRKQQIDYEEISTILKQTCSAVHTAHLRGIIHRDLKPDNIWLLNAEDASIHVKVLDFGIAKLKSAPGTVNLTQKGMIVGTPFYMSPEQCRGEELDAGSDIYSLGIILYEMITGKVPFEAATPLAVVLRHNSEPPRPLHELRADVSDRVEKVVLRALAKKREERQESALQLAEQFEKALNASTKKAGIKVSDSTLAIKSHLPNIGAKQLPNEANGATKAYDAAVSVKSLFTDQLNSSESGIAEESTQEVVGAIAFEQSDNLKQAKEAPAAIPLAYGNLRAKTSPAKFNAKVYLIVGVIAAALIIATLFLASSRKPSNQELSEAPIVTTQPDMVLIDSATFLMGTDDPDAKPEWKPAHQVKIDSFYIDIHEVTNADYDRFIKQTGHAAPPHWKNGSYPKGEGNLPVYYVSWYDARDYTKWAGKRLPTESEWEYAARGKEGLRYPWGNEWNDELTVSGEEKPQKPAAVGSFPRSNSPFGIFDMAGNVSEWVNDDFTPYPGSKGKPAVGYKVYRGGNYRISGKEFVTAARWTEVATEKQDTIGFRCVKDISK